MSKALPVFSNPKGKEKSPLNKSSYFYLMIRETGKCEKNVFFTTPILANLNFMHEHRHSKILKKTFFLTILICISFAQG